MLSRPRSLVPILAVVCLAGSLETPAPAQAGPAVTFRESRIFADTESRRFDDAIGSWSDSLTVDRGGTCENGNPWSSHSHADQTATTALGPDWVRVTVSGNVAGSASGGCFGPGEGGGWFDTDVRFTLDQAMPYTAVATIGPGATQLLLDDTDVPDSAPFNIVNQPGNYSFSGTLAAGPYHLLLSAMHSGQSVDSSSSLDLKVGSVPGPPPVNISDGPPPLTTATTASFTFAAATTPPPGAYECSLDNAAFAQCTSPMPYAGLADGEHTFQVRFHPDGDAPGAVTSRTWTVDTTPPVAAIDAAPSGNSNPPDATIRFSSSEPAGATFECRIDDQPEAPCTSPLVLSSLAPGPHAFSVKARDAAGNVSTPAETSWQVSATDCASNAIPVGFAKACGATLQETEAGSRIYKTANRAWVGGFEIVPKPEGKLVVDRNTNELRAEGAGVEVVFANRVVPLPLNLIPVGEQGGAEVSFGGGGEVSLFGLPIEAALKVAWTDGGTGSDLEMSVQIEELAELLGEISGGAEDVATELKAHQANGTGFQLTGAKVEANGEIKIIPRALRLPRALTLKNLGLSYELKDGKDFWVGQAGLGLPFGGTPASPGLEITGKVSIYDGGLAGAGLKVDGFNKPIGSTPFFLQSVEGELLFRPEFGFDIGVGGTFGPRVADIELTTFNANVRGWALAEGCESGVDPIEFAFTGEIKPLEQLGVGSATIEGTHCLYASSLAVEVSDKIELTFGQSGEGDALGFEGTAKGFVSTTAFNLEGAATVKLPVLPDFTGSELVSSRGIAACADVGWFSGGFGYSWGESLPSAFSGCDLEPWRAAGSAGATAAGSARRIEVPDGLPFVGIRVKGTTRAPRLRIRGPKGEHFAGGTPGRAVRNDRVMIVPVARERTTYVFVRRPSAGTWRLSPVGGGNRIARVSSARGLAKPSVKASVRPRKRGRKRTLTYRVRRVRGQRVEFTERATGVAHRLGVARKARGKIRFRPAAADDRTREIEALVLQNGVPRASLTVARLSVR